MDTYSAWGRPNQCNQLLCGLNPKWTCSQRHLPLHHVSIQPEAPPHREEETAGQKSSAHSLFTQISTTGFGLGRTTPETNLDLFHGTYQSSLTTRQGVFRHLTGVYNCKPEDKGFHWEERDTDWGRQTFAIGRTQRDWLKIETWSPVSIQYHPQVPSTHSAYKKHTNQVLASTQS